MIYDFFISHSSKDKEEYILPLCQKLEDQRVRFWLDETEIKWGDNIVNKINSGLSKSEYVLICLSENFLESNWTETEWTAMFANELNKGKNRVLPLILNSKEIILDTYPLLASKKYKEISEGIDIISNELAKLSNRDVIIQNNTTEIDITIESRNSGTQFKFKIDSNASFNFLNERAINITGLKTQVNLGQNTKFKIKWVLVESKAIEYWKKMSRHSQERTVSLVNDDERIIEVSEKYDKLKKHIKTPNITFHMFAVENYPSKGGGGGGGGDRVVMDKIRDDFW